jgi:uncharacterized OB-fold protein/NAD(P)-dependent dehydrogenase (short-subunit alcohol dehydrogenase family)
MTEPLTPPGPKKALARTPSALSPPMPRSRKAMEFTVFAARGEFRLQRCGQCGTIVYPFREACSTCLSVDLAWEEVTPVGTLIAMTTIRSSPDGYFSHHLPWRSGTVQLDNGPPMMVHVHGAVKVNERVRLIARTDKAGNGVIFALPEQDTPNMMDDPQLRELTCSPKYRRVLITDGTSRIGQAMAKALLGADASMVMLGIPARVGAGRVDEALAARPDVRLVPLEVTDQTSVAEAATQIGAKVDILINTAFHIRPGGALARHNSITDRDEMDVHYFGLLNLVRAFGPILGSRGADEPRSATAWVSLLSAFALGNWSPLGGSSASFAAAHSALQGLRSDLAGSGVKVITAFFGPTDDEWYDHLQPPKVGPDLIARKIVSALEQGIEQVAAGAIAEDILERWRDNPELLPRELARG